MDIYVIGHKNPDTDSVAGAIALAEIMGYKSAICGPINRETTFVLERLNIETPEILADISGKKVFLVDHNENTQMAEGWKNAEIIGVTDHHKINFSSSAPVFFHAETLGSTCSVIAKTYMNAVTNNPRLAKILLAGILSDTIIFKSPTTTEEDRDIANTLAKVAGELDILQFGKEIKTAGADISGKTIKEIISTDFKEFDMNGRRVGIGQVELPDLSLIKDMEQAIITQLDEIKTDGYELVIMVATDIIAEGSKLFFAGDPVIIQKAFGVAPEGRAIFVKGLMSRKKQVVPPLEEAFR